MNDYSALEQLVRQSELDGVFSGPQWQMPVSIMVVTYNQEWQLALNLHALRRQMYDPRLMEVVIADDGGRRGAGSSMNAVANAVFPFDVKYIWQPDAGYRLAKMRNEALKRAAHDTVIQIDSDVVPAHDYVREVTKWHWAARHLQVHLICLPRREFVEPEAMTRALIEERTLYSIERGRSRKFNREDDWREDRYKSTDRLKHVTGGNPDYYTGTTFVGCGVSFSRANVFEAGLYDEDFTVGSGEDTELGVRMFHHFNRKLGEPLYIVPLNVTGFHIEHDREGAGDSSNQPLIKEKAKLKQARPVAPRPAVSVVLACPHSKEAVEQALLSVASQRGFDLREVEVVLTDDGSTGDMTRFARRLRERFGEAPTVRVSQYRGGGGVADGTNGALWNCRGEYILELEPAIRLLGHALRTLYELLERHPLASLAFGSEMNVAGHEAGGASASAEEFTDRWYEETAVDAGDLRTTFETLKTLGVEVGRPRMFRRSSFFATEGVDTRCDDAVSTDLVYKLSRVGQPRRHVGKLCVYGRGHEAEFLHVTAARRRIAEMFARRRAFRDPAISKEAIIAEERVSRYDLEDPLGRVEVMTTVWRDTEKGRNGSVVFDAIIGELEDSLRFFEAVRPDVASELREILRGLEPENPVLRTAPPP